MLQVAHHTSWFTALILTGWLKVLHLFDFMKWHPTSFLKTTTDVPFFRYVILFFILYLGVFVLFFLLANLPYFSLFFGALVIGLLLSYGFISWFEGEWVKERKTFARSIPFIVTVLTVVRFVYETASFHRVAKKRQKKLPYKASTTE